MACDGLKKGSSPLFGQPIFLCNLIWKSTNLTYFSPIFKAFWDSKRAKTGHHKLKTRQKQSFGHSMSSKITFEKSLFFCNRCTLLNHFGTHLFGSLGYFVRLAANHGIQVRGSRCRNRVLSHTAQDMVRFSFGAVDGQCAKTLGLLGAFWGRVADI